MNLFNEIEILNLLCYKISFFRECGFQYIEMSKTDYKPEKIMKQILPKNCNEERMIKALMFMSEELNKK